MFDTLTTRLSRVLKTLRGEARITEDNVKDALREVRMALLEADVALPVVRVFIDSVREKALGQEVIGSLTPGQAVVGVVHRELTALMGEHNDALDLAAAPPAVVLMAGLQGSGKTTPSGKLAKLLKRNRKKKWLLVSCDVYRPRRSSSFETLAEQVGVDFLRRRRASRPVDIAKRALDQRAPPLQHESSSSIRAAAAIDEAMMKEIRELHDAVKPIETLFVVRRDAGRMRSTPPARSPKHCRSPASCGPSSTAIHAAGAALSVRHITGKRSIRGVGEKLSGLEPFHPDRMASRILGMGDGHAVETCRRPSTARRPRSSPRRSRRAKASTSRIQAADVQMKKMGGSRAVDKLPGHSLRSSRRTRPTWTTRSCGGSKASSTR